MTKLSIGSTWKTFIKIIYTQSVSSALARDSKESKSVLVRLLQMLKESKCTKKAGRPKISLTSKNKWWLLINYLQNSSITVFCSN